MQKISRKRFEWLKQKHYELWDWLSKNPDKYKNDWFELYKNKGIRARNRCFACQFDLEAKGNRTCTRCPIGSGKAAIEEDCLGGLFERYTKAEFDYRIRKTSSLRDKVIELAKQIRDLPWSEEYVEDEEMNNENYIVINGKKTELTEEQLKQLGIEVGKNKRWRAERGKNYWRISSENKVVPDMEANVEQDCYCYDTHNYFKTEEEAKEYAEVLEIKRQLMKFADEHNDKIDWKDINQFGYVICWNPCLNDIRICKDGFKTAPEIIYFSSVDIAQKAIDTIGKDNIIKYLTYNY